MCSEATAWPAKGRVKLLPQDEEVYVFAESQDRIAKERSMRRRQLKWLWARLKKLSTMKVTRDVQAPELADKIDGAIGEGSQFHRSFGYYAQGAGPETATLPKDWMQRVHRVQSNNTNGRVGYCRDVLDLLSCAEVPRSYPHGPGGTRRLLPSCLSSLAQ